VSVKEISIYLVCLQWSSKDENVLWNMDEIYSQRVLALAIIMGKQPVTSK
jgi:hypothetical protein